MGFSSVIGTITDGMVTDAIKWVGDFQAPIILVGAILVGGIVLSMLFSVVFKGR